MDGLLLMSKIELSRLKVMQRLEEKSLKQKVRSGLFLLIQSALPLGAGFRDYFFPGHQTHWA
jgi:hypothetical protein